MSTEPVSFYQNAVCHDRNVVYSEQMTDRVHKARNLNYFDLFSVVSFNEQFYFRKLQNSKENW